MNKCDLDKIMKVYLGNSEFKNAIPLFTAWGVQFLIFGGSVGYNFSKLLCRTLQKLCSGCDIDQKRLFNSYCRG